MSEKIKALGHRDTCTKIRLPLGANRSHWEPSRRVRRALWEDFPGSCVEGTPEGRGTGQQGMHRAGGDGSTMLYEGSRKSRHRKGGTREMLIGGTSRLQ